MKLSPITIIILGFMVCIPLVCFGFFMHWMPNKAEEKLNRDILEQLNTEIGKKKKAIERRQKAVDMVNVAADDWQRIVSQRTPPKSLSSGGIDLSVNPYQLTVDVQTYRNSIQKAVNAQMHAGHVKIINGPAIPDIDPNQSASAVLAGFFNYPAISFPVVIFDLGTITVQGTMSQIFDHVRAWARMPHYLAVADGLRLDGTSPVLTGTYNLSIVGYIRGKKIAPAIEEASAPSSSGFGGPGIPGGFPGGGPGGFPGGGGVPGGRARGGAGGGKGGD